MTTVLLTGATGKIGGVILRRLLACGYRVIVVSRSEDRIEKLKATAEGLPLSGVCQDLLEENAVKDLVDKLGDSSRIDAMVHAARDVATLKPLSEVTRSDWLTEYNLAAVVPYFLTKELSRNGTLESVVFLSSIYGMVAQNTSLYDGNAESLSPHYGVAKASQIQLVRSLSVELSPSIRVNCVSYGGVVGRTKSDFQNRYSRLCPIGRMLTEEDIAGPILFLIDRTQSSGMTGANIVVDGGWTVW